VTQTLTNLFDGFFIELDNEAPPGQPAPR
jgi:hypothetical protein